MSDDDHENEKSSNAAREADAALTWNWCPTCKQHIDIDDDTHEGSRVRCLGCRAWYVVCCDGDGAWSLESEAEHDAEGEADDARGTAKDASPLTHALDAEGNALCPYDGTKLAYVSQRPERVTCPACREKTAKEAEGEGLGAVVVPLWLARLTPEQIKRINAIPATGPAPWDIAPGALADAIAGTTAEPAPREPSAPALDAPVYGYAASEDAEEWSAPYSSREEAISAASEDSDLDGGEIWIVKGRRLDPAAAMPSAWWLIEMMPDGAAEQNWYEGAVEALEATIGNLPPEAIAELDAALAAWARRWCPMRGSWEGTGRAERVREASDGDEG